MPELKQNTVTIVKVGTFVGTTGTVITDLTIPQASVRLSKKGGNMAQKSTATACVHDEIGVYFCDLSAADTDTLGSLRLDVDKSGSAALSVFHIYDVVTAQYWDAKYGTGRFEVDVQEIDGASAGVVNMQNMYDGTGYAGGSIQQITTPGNATLTAGVFAGSALLAATFGSDFLTADKIADDSIAAEHIAGSALVAASFAAGALAEGAASAATINAEVLDVMSVDTFAEPGQGAPGATATIVTKLGYLHKFMRNKIISGSTEIGIYNDDGTTKGQKSTISSDGTLFTRGEFGTGA